jgi:Putative auto-transporter adhesin, head GIN domain
MRPTLPTTSFALIAVTLLAACSAANGRDRDDDNGPTSTRNFNLSDFDAVVLAASDDVRITEGSAFAVSATASEKVLDRLEFSVKNGVLKIGRKNDRSWLSWSHDKGAVIDVTMPVIHKAAIAGSGDMKVAGTATDTFTGSISGSGNLDIAQVRAERTALSIAGSGDLSAAGATKQVELSVAGSGDINAGGLKSVDLDASIAGSGDIRANATGKASASIVGSGDIDISGITNCTVSKVGSGDVRCTG